MFSPWGWGQEVELHYDTEKPISIMFTHNNKSGGKLSMEVLNDQDWKRRAQI